VAHADDPQAPAAPPPFPGLPAVPQLPGIDHDMLGRWAAGQVFARSLEQTAGGPLWSFYDGPPSANGVPGAHHIAARASKDTFGRFKTMQGFHVPRRAGWDCHGLPVEVAVERELGLTTKPEVEAYGIAEFNARCRESVLRHIQLWEALTERMGYWTDLAGAYRTMDRSYIDSVWWSLKVIYDRGLIVQDYRVSPYCPRCGTPLSDHELGQPGVYREVSDPSVIVRYRLLTVPPGADSRFQGADLLVWTTTPWTLVASTAVAVHPEETYVVGRKAGQGDRVVLAEALFARVLGEGWHVAARIRGADLAGATYQRPLELIEVPGGQRVVTAGFVTTADGTGLVHLAPAFGADDLAAGRAHGLPVVNPVRGDGTFEESIPLVGGLFFQQADQPVLRNLADRGLVFRSAPHEHSYPHCWRCHTPLLYYALPSWYIKTTAITGELLAENEQVTWQPPTIKHGRYGEWLRTNVDWAMSRSRFWGTPLPLWVCPDQHVTCVGSLAELGQRAGTDLNGLDPHRPYVDDVLISCGECGQLARRVPEVLDAWYDSGAMPFAQVGAPHQRQEEFTRGYPAAFIAEAQDQTRGWFYSLMAVGTLVFGRSAYTHALCLGLLTDDRGRKMSKNLGNVLEPIPLMDRYGADAVRWFFTATAAPWSSRGLSPAELEEIVRKVLLTYWNIVSFLIRYANAAAVTGQHWNGERIPGAPPVAERPVLDRWLISELHGLIRDVTAALEDLDSAGAGRRIATFIDDTSNWYVRRSRRRFWAGPGSPDGAAAFATLYTCAETLTRLMAPLAPFLTDYLWGVLRTPADPESVHLARWPAADPELIDAELSSQMALARRLTELGRAARASAAVRVRQPLGRALAGADGFAGLPAGLRTQVAEELNVHTLDPLSAVDGDREITDTTVKPSFRELGRRFGPRTPAVAAAIETTEPAELAAALRLDGTATIQVEGEPVALEPGDVIITQVPRSGWAVATQDGETVALDVTITPRLRREGLTREVIRLIQEARKQDGLQLSDRIAVRYQTGDQQLAQALDEHRDLIATEVLAVSLRTGSAMSEGSPAQHTDEELGLTFWLSVVPAS
jgi:isoleucyl-tRNA synthetase